MSRLGRDPLIAGGPIARSPGEQIHFAPSARQRRAWWKTKYQPTPQELAELFAKDPDVQRARRRAANRGYVF